MKRAISLKQLHAVAPNRRPGYVQAVLSASSPVSEDFIAIAQEDYVRLRDEFVLRAGGPGTELKKLLRAWGIVAKPNCSCNRRARMMDEKGVEWCEANIDEIVGWLREEATKRKLPFVDLAGRLLVKRAIRNARRAAS